MSGKRRPPVRDLADAGLGHRRFGDVGIVGQHRHPEGLGARGQRTADPAEADQEQRPSGKLERLEPRPRRVPVAAPDRAVMPEPGLGERQHQEHRVLGDGAGMDAADHRQRDALLGQRIDRHVVVADPVARHDLEPAGIDQRLARQDRRPDEERVGVGKFCDELGGVLARHLDQRDVVPRPKHGHAVGMELSGKKDARHGWRPRQNRRGR